MEPLATVAQLNERFAVSPDLELEAAGTLMDLSEDARYYGSSDWETISTTPQSVTKLILRATVRHLKNPDGLTDSRAGDEAVSWNRSAEQFSTPGGATFTGEEKARLREYAGRGSATSLWSVGTFTGAQGGGSSRRRRYGRANSYDQFEGDDYDGNYVPVQGGGDPFPFSREWEDDE